MSSTEEFLTFLRQNPLLPLPSSDYDRLVSRGDLRLSSEDRHHFRVVMRTRGAFPVTVTDGAGAVVQAMVSDDDLIRPLEEPLLFVRSAQVKLIMPPIKRKNLELLIQKAVEHGVDEIIFIDSEYCNHPIQGLSRFEKVVRNSAIQSRNMFLPVLREVKSRIEKFPFDEHALCFWGDFSAEKDVFSAVSAAVNEKPGRDLVFINGPEGGWSPAEENFLKNRFPGICLSENVLRSESAALFAAACLKLFVHRTIGKK